MKLLRVLFVLVLVWRSHVSSAHAESPQPWIDPEGIKGTLVAVGGGALPDSVRNLIFDRAGGAKGRLVVIPTASETADTDPPERTTKVWSGLGFESVTRLHTHSREEADKPEFVKPLQEATAVWFDGGAQSKLAEAYVGTAVAREIAAVLARGGIVAGTSAGAAIQSEVMIARNNPVPEISTGLPLFPGAIIDQHFTQRKREPRLAWAIERHRGLVGVGIDEGTAAVLTGRDLRVMGEGQVTFCLAESPFRAALSKPLKAGEMVDWVAMQRAARDRSGGNWPPKTVPEPDVPSGSLVIVGGGAMPKEIVDRFIELAGGPDTLIVVLPTANPPDPRRPPEVDGQFLKRAGAKNVKTLPHRYPQVKADPEFLKTLAEARGVWFGGGRQWRFVDAYEGTAAIEAFRDVLKRGGVIGGSSAGATIQGDYLCRASPLGNLQMMAEGYEKGFAFLPGTAIDQHFTQRNRFADMTSLMAACPQYLGLGLDEGTALIVRGHVAEVIGPNQVHVYNRRVPLVAGEPDHLSLKAGMKYDLKDRKVITP